MFKNFILLAWRNIVKHKTFSFINILGLSAGMAFVLLIGAYVWGELRVNDAIRDNDRVFMLQSKWQKAEMGMELTTPAPLAKALKENFPDLVEDYYHHDGISSIVSKGNKYFREGLQPGDASFLTLTGFPLLQGDARTALNNPNSIVITEAKARKYFGRTDVMGETLTLQSFAGGAKQDFIITGVLKDLPYNTITNFTNTRNELFLPVESLRFFGRYDGFQAWQNVYIINYVKLKEGVRVADLQQPIQQLLKLHTTADVVANLQVKLTPLNEYYLQLNNGLARRMVYTMSIVALFILVMAVINFINISIGNATTRLKEIGVRKVMGGTRQQLMGQFLIESIVMAALSVILALGIYQWAIPFAGKMLGRPLPSLTSLPVQFVAIPVLMALVIGALAGLYPAFVLSLQPSVDSLKGKLKTIKEKVIFRRSLIALQFTTAIVVFIGAIIIDKQITFSFNSSLGYDREQIITATVPRDWTVEGVRHMETVRNEIASLPVVTGATVSYEIPDGMSGGGGRLFKAGQDSSEAVIFNGLSTDDKYAATYGMKMVAGKFLEKDTTTLVINETGVKAMGWQDAAAALGQLVRMEGNPRTYTITGVIKDFHFESKHAAIGPLFINNIKNTLVYRYLSFRVKPGNLSKTLTALESKWATVLPGAPFDYKFMDDTLGFMYRSEIQLKKAAQTATLLALVIVLLGVLGIVTLSITRRMKEVGIRKVLGASGGQIIVLFLKEFAWMILLANLIAWPLAYLALENWLDNFVYRIHINWVPFITVAAVLATLIAAIVAIQTIIKALTNPIRNLRSE